MIAEILPKIENSSKELEGEEADLENIKKVFTGHVFEGKISQKCVYDNKLSQFSQHALKVTLPII